MQQLFAWWYQGSKGNTNYGCNPVLVKNTQELANLYPNVGETGAAGSIVTRTVFIVFISPISPVSAAYAKG